MYGIEFLDSDFFALFILPLLIFFARVIDVTFGTIRIIFVSKGEKFLAPIFGFFEIMIWLFAIGQVMQNLTNITYYIAYAAGFATGNFVGIYIEDKMAIGKLVVRIITKKDACDLIDALKSKNYGITIVDAQGATGSVKIIFTVIKRQDADDVVGMIKHFNPRAFFSMEEVRAASEGVFPSHKSRFNFLSKLRMNRPGK
ncbi:MAG: DUF2179 domain-containing protein [Euryarchaeota archaeon]|nr:DUF2179 domain-containing protein [Euryarchaeota archaeon]